jgi:hypothetical protein
MKAPAKSLVKVWTLNLDEKISSLLVDGADGCCLEPRSEISPCAQ